MGQLRSHVRTNSVAIISGGLDSTVLVHHMFAQGYVPHLLSFDYGQRHRKELQFARMTAQRLSLPHDIIDLSGITHLISNSALTAPREYEDGFEKNIPRVIEVPEGHYAEDNMKATVVPNRNMIMLSIAAGVAVNKKAKTIGVGVHAGDHFIYPDCRPEFIFAVGQAILAGNDGFHNFNMAGNEPLVEYESIDGKQKTFFPAMPIFAPFLGKTKADIVYNGIELGVPIHLTWSCYKGGDKHCGRCGTCVERLEAIAEAAKRWKVEHEVDIADKLDRTQYEDTEYWKQTVREGGNVVDLSDFH